MPIHLSFHICDIKEFDLLIGYPLEKLLKEGHTGIVDVCLGRTIKVLLHFSHSIHTKTEPSPEPDPMEEVNEASLEHFEESTKYFHTREHFSALKGLIRSHIFSFVTFYVGLKYVKNMFSGLFS
jgi:hypothetical protein